MRKLTLDDVTLTVFVEPCDEPVRGNFMVTDDPEQDKRDEDAILERLYENHDTTAWCDVVVEAKYKCLTAQAGTGCLSYAEAQAEHFDVDSRGRLVMHKAIWDFDDLIDETLADLNAQIADLVADLED